MNRFLVIVPSVLVALPFACSNQPAHIGLVMRAPLGLLDQATGVQLSVFPAGNIKCDPANGHVDKIPSGEDTQKFPLDSSGCPSGVSWCKDIELEQGSTPKMFAVIASNAAGVLAEGCTVATVNQDPLEVSIKVQRYNPPACCNDGTLQAGEQCDVGGDASCTGISADEVCDGLCRAQEILLSVDNPSPPPTIANGPAGTKSQLALAFAPGNGQRQNALRAVYRNTHTDAVGGSDINIRFLSQDLKPITSPFSLSQQLRMPLLCTDVDGGGITRVQELPSITPIGVDLTGIVYASDEVNPANPDVWLIVHSPDGCKCDPSDVQCLGKDTPTQLNLMGGATDPDIASGPADAALTVWTRQNRVHGRIWNTDGTLLPTSLEITVTTSGSHPRVAGFADGWLVVYQGSGSGDPDGIYMKRIDINGSPAGEMLVNQRVDGVQEQPDVAVFPDGRAIVVWHSDTDIYFQRYDAAGVAVMGDQDAPLNTTRDGEQFSPAVAASVGLGDFYAIVWEHADTGEIYARFTGATEGFFFNSVTGQNGDFVASHPDIDGLRHSPAVAIGGAGYVAIGWQDDSAMHPGVYVRRFPLASPQ